MHNGNQYLHGDIYANNKNNINVHIHGNVQMGSVSAQQLPMQQDLSQHRAYYRDTGLYRQPEFPQPVQYQPSLPTNGFPVHAPRLATQPVMRYGQAPAAQQQYYMPSESVAGPWTHPESGPFSTSTSQGTIIHVAGFSMQPTVAAPGPDVSSWSGADDVLPPSASSSHMVAHSSEDRLAKLKRKDEREHERDERTVRGPF
ncbi:hypothetical protein BD626DRAFT_509207 [Schizophyllum amplum]|uniref:Uncharacterized protein n=1 Tax=Schizophyllum amplum TaxID=97359 RepID=A0A550C2U9_9AGAR|nr:hypothetical protein BD626DRAFT_509207 [Auriculariopsis ampla]